MFFCSYVFLVCDPCDPQFCEIYKHFTLKIEEIVIKVKKDLQDHSKEKVGGRMKIWHLQNGQWIH